MAAQRHRQAVVECTPLPSDKTSLNPSKFQAVSFLPPNELPGCLGPIPNVVSPQGRGPPGKGHSYRCGLAQKVGWL